MITIRVFACRLSRIAADALNCESRRIYTARLVEHYRVYRHTRHRVSSRGLSAWSASSSMIVLTRCCRSRLRLSMSCRPGRPA